MLYPEKTFLNICLVKIHHVKREATHLADRQANLGVRLQSCSQWMGGLPFQKRF